MTVNNFSLLLKQHIHNSQHSIVALAKFIGVNRTSLQKYMSGNQLPSDYSAIDKLGKILTLSNFQKNELKKAYMIEQIGYLRYQKINKLKTTITNYCDYTLQSNTNFTINYDFKEIDSFAKNPEELKLLTQFIINDAMNSDHELELLINTDNCIYPIIKSTILNNSNLKINLLLYLQSQDNNNFSIHNIEQLNNLLSILSTNNDIHVKYFYCKNDNPDYYGLFPYSISSQNYVLLINPDYTAGTILTNDTTYLNNEFKRKFKLANFFFISTINFECNLLSLLKDNQNIQIYGHQPSIYFWTLASKELKDFLQNNTITMYFTLSGFYTLFNQYKNKQELLMIYNKMLNNENNNLNIYLINEEALAFSRNLSIITSSQKLLMSLNNKKYICINEVTLIEDFTLLNNLFELETCNYNHEKSISLLKQTLTRMEE